jgi:hypothetical protein
MCRILNDRDIPALLSALRRQSYPLVITEDQAEALVECMRRVMASVPDQEHSPARTDFDLAASALFHPST